MTETAIYSTIFGSHLYGTETGTGDFDYQIVFLPSLKSIVLGEKVSLESRQNIAGSVDETRHPLIPFMRRLSEGNGTMLEVLFSSQIHKNLGSTWKEVWKNRESFIPRKSKSMLGYCRSQSLKFSSKGKKLAAARFIRDLLVANLGFATTVEKAIAGESIYFNEFGNDVFLTNLFESSNTVTKALYVCGKYIPLHLKLQDALNIVNKIVDFFGDRTNSSYPVDWKGAYHALRIAEQAVEYHRDAFMTFPRPNAKYLRNIRFAEIPVQEVEEKIEEAQLTAETLYDNVKETSKIPPRDNADRYALSVYGL